MKAKQQWADCCNEKDVEEKRRQVPEPRSWIHGVFVAVRWLLDLKTVSLGKSVIASKTHFEIKENKHQLG